MQNTDTLIDSSGRTRPTKYTKPFKRVPVRWAKCVVCGISHQTNNECCTRPCRNVWLNRIVEMTAKEAQTMVFSVGSRVRINKPGAQEHGHWGTIGFIDETLKKYFIWFDRQKPVLYGNFSPDEIEHI